MKKKEIVEDDMVAEVEPEVETVQEEYEHPFERERRLVREAKVLEDRVSKQ